MKELHDLTVELLAKPKLTLDALRSYAGKANHVAALIYQWRPFLDQIWAALSINKVGTTAPVGNVWTQQVSSSLGLCLTFLRGSPGELVRSWRVDLFSHRGIEVIMILDASPFGLGGSSFKMDVLLAGSLQSYRTKMKPSTSNREVRLKGSKLGRHCASWSPCAAGRPGGWTRGCPSRCSHIIWLPCPLLRG